MRRTLPRLLFLSLVLPAIAAPAAVAADFMVAQRDFLFDPAVVVISSADRVLWMNQGVAMPHTSTSGAPGDPNAGALWDSGFVAPGGSFLVDTWTATGDLDYFCGVHPTQMFGVVIVDGTGVHAATIPVITMVPLGQPLQLTAWLLNLDATPHGVNAQIQVIAPNGLTRTVANANLSLPADSQINRPLAINLPAAAPPGDYRVTLEARDPGGVLLASDEVTYSYGSISIEGITVEWPEGPLQQ